VSGAYDDLGQVKTGERSSTYRCAVEHSSPSIGSRHESRARRDVMVRLRGEG